LPSGRGKIEHEDYNEAGSWIGWEGAVARADADRAALARFYVRSLDARALALDLLP